MTINLEDIYGKIEIARDRIKDNIHETPIDYSHTLSRMTDSKFFLKLENLQKTGSFKVRGALNKLMSLSEEKVKKGVIAASAGNHAQGVAYAASIVKLNL
jgi:Threonine dehydratase